MRRDIWLGYVCPEKFRGEALHLTPVAADKGTDHLRNLWHRAVPLQQNHVSLKM